MSIKFIPESLKDEAKELFTFFEEYGINVNDEIGLESYFHTDEDAEEEIFVDRQIKFDFYFDSGNHDYEDHNVSLERLLDVVSEAKKRRIIDGDKFIGDKVALIPINSYDDSILKARYQAPDIVTQYIKNKKYTIEIVEDITSYGMSLVIENLYTEYIPAFNYEDVFIEIRCDDGIDETVIENLVQAYLFELKSSFKLNIHTSQRIIAELTDTIDEDEDDDNIPSRARPLLEGKGIKELLQIYNSTLSTDDAEILMLNYTKVIEYVSQTVIQQELIGEALKKLASPKALKPDAEYILELGKVFEDYRNNKKEHQAIKLTVQTCCDISEIVSIAPSFLKVTSKLATINNQDNKQKAIEEIATAINNTRNMFAHAKTNYEKKGMECPKEQLYEFVMCVDILAQQVIRWFDNQREENRVV
ncbi:hypothetical protein ABEY04_01275 [Bacillus mycoides]|uniref:hypothetical protein n=1 Tax=Bacillus mycoides TaxID=1405 RepID=UPI003D21B60C